MRSSNERAKASMAPAAMAGARSGSVTYRKAPQADAPRSRAASSTCGSRLTARARTTTATYETQNVMCAIEIWASEPLAEKSCGEEEQQADAQDDLRRDHRQQDERLGQRRRRSACAAGPGRCQAASQEVETTTATRATSSVFTQGLEHVLVGEERRVPVEREAASRRSCPSESLKLKMMRTTMGRNRKT